MPTRFTSPSGRHCYVPSVTRNVSRLRPPWVELRPEKVQSSAEVLVARSAELASADAEQETDVGGHRHGTGGQHSATDPAALLGRAHGVVQRVIQPVEDLHPILAEHVDRDLAEV